LPHQRETFMKRIVLCFDGTWNQPTDEHVTNVCRFYKSVRARDANGITQEAWYNSGVGTAWWDKHVGGGMGAGLDLHIIEGYKRLVQIYQPGDEVFIVGFSRGAYTARSLVGMIRNCGLVKPGLDDAKIAFAYAMYRTRDDGVDSLRARMFRSTFSRPLTIKFLGVWDTVGALGIPLHIASHINAAYYQFHDTELSALVENAYHAVAIDEHRED
jgi:uncharacterized protein (DUF2235 family)